MAVYAYGYAASPSEGNIGLDHPAAGLQRSR